LISASFSKWQKKELHIGTTRNTFIYNIKSKIDHQSTHPSSEAIANMDVPALLNELKQMEARPPTFLCLAVIQEIDSIHVRHE
jgi:hypothetical protein